MKIFKDYHKADKRNKIPPHYIVTMIDEEEQSAYKLETEAHFGGIYSVKGFLNGHEVESSKYYNFCGAKGRINQLTKEIILGGVYDI